MKTLALLTPGTLPYGQALTLQLELRDAIASLPPEEQELGYLLCLEHPPVVTLGKRGELDALLDPSVLRAHGIEVFKIDRGGEATYHEPGQLVVYPILPLKSMGLGVVDLIRNMAACMAEAVAPYGAEVAYDKETPGLWTNETERAPRKIASVGMRVSGGVTTHGLAINLVNPMHGFQWIVACGMPNAPICNLLQLMDNPPETAAERRALFEAVQQDFLSRFARYLGFPLTPVTRPLPPQERWVTGVNPMFEQSEVG